MRNLHKQSKCYSQFDSCPSYFWLFSLSPSNPSPLIMFLSSPASSLQMVSQGPSQTVTSLSTAGMVHIWKSVHYKNTDLKSLNNENNSFILFSVTTMSSVCPLTPSGPSLSSAPSPVTPPPRSDASPAPPSHSTLSLNTGWVSVFLSLEHTHSHFIVTQFCISFSSLAWANVGDCSVCVCVQMYFYVCGFVIRSSWHKKNGDVSNYITDFAASLRWIQPAESVCSHTPI